MNSRPHPFARLNVDAADPVRRPEPRHGDRHDDANVDSPARPFDEFEGHRGDEDIDDY